MDKSYMTVMDESYFIIPDYQTDSVWQPGLKNSTPSVAEVNAQSDLVNDIICGKCGPKSLCSKCEEELLHEIEQQCEQLRYQIREYDILELSLRKQKSYSSTTTTTDRKVDEDNIEKESLRTIQFDYDDISKKLQEVNTQKQYYQHQIEEMNYQHNSIQQQIDEEIIGINMIESHLKSSTEELRCHLDVSNTTLEEMNILSTLSINSVFTLISQSNVMIINGFRLAYQPSLKVNLTWMELYMSWTLVSQMIIMLRHKYHLSTTLTFMKLDHFRTQNFNDSPYQYQISTQKQSGNTDSYSKTSSSSIQKSDDLYAYRMLRLQPLRSHCILYVRDIVTSTDPYTFSNPNNNRYQDDNRAANSRNSDKNSHVNSSLNNEKGRIYTNSNTQPKHTRNPSTGYLTTNNRNTMEEDEVYNSNDDDVDGEDIDYDEEYDLFHSTFPTTTSNSASSSNINTNTSIHHHHPQQQRQRQRQRQSRYYDKETIYNMKYDSPISDNINGSNYNSSNNNCSSNCSRGSQHYPGSTAHMVQYQISIHLLAIALVCTIYETNHSELIPSDSLLYPILQSLIQGNTENLLNMNTAKLFEFIDRSYILHVESDDEDDDDDDNIDVDNMENIKEGNNGITRANLSHSNKSTNITSSSDGHFQLIEDYVHMDTDTSLHLCEDINTTATAIKTSSLISTNKSHMKVSTTTTKKEVLSPSSTLSFEEECDTHNTVFINRGKSISKMNLLVKDIFHILQLFSQI